MGELFFGVDIAGTINENVSPGLPTVATLTKRITGTRTPGALTDGTQPTTQTATGKVVVSDYCAGQIDGTLIKAGDRKVLFIAESMSPVLVPEAGDRVTVEGATYFIVSVGRDPAVATYACQVRTG